MEKLSTSSTPEASQETISDFLTITRSRHLKLLKTYSPNISETETKDDKEKEEIKKPPPCENCQYKSTALLCEFVSELNRCVLRLPKHWEDYFMLDGSVKPIIIFG